MRQEITDFLSTTEVADIERDVSDLMDDVHLSVVLTYRDFLSMTRTVSTGAFTPAYQDTQIRGIRNEVSAREVAAGAGLYQVGDIAFLVAQSDLPNVTAPVREDRLQVEGTTYELVHWSGDPISRLWRLIARRVK